MEWRDSASCKNMDTNKFFDGWFAMEKDEKRVIVAMCEQCPVLRQCYQYAERSFSHGIWAGKFFKNGKSYSPFSHRRREAINFDELQNV